VRFDLQAGKVHLSQVLNWYGEDFIRWFPATPAAPVSPTLIDYLLIYLPADQARLLRRHPAVEIVFDEYDWTLNDRPVK
jgi:hypothetical protein